MVVPLPGEAVSMAAYLFGKLPTHGDFVTRGMAAAERDALDRWISAGMEGVRAQLGDMHNSLYDSAPPWRFISEDSVGAIAPSMDSAGRRYPILLAVRNGCFNCTHLATACEELLYTAFADSWTADQLADAAASLSPEPDDLPTTPRWWTEGNAHFPPAELAGDRPADFFPTLLRPREDHG